MRTRLLCLAALLVFTPLAQAHTRLAGSEPADQAVLAVPPESLMLHFSEAVRLTALSVQPENGPKRSLGPLPAEASAHFSVAAPELAAGRYTVSWRALSADTHVMSGELVFTVGEAGAAPVATRPPEASHAGH